MKTLLTITLLAALITSCAPEPIGCDCHDDFIFYPSTERATYYEETDTWMYFYQIEKGFGGRYDIEKKEGWYWGKIRLTEAYTDSVHESYPVDLRTLNFSNTIYCK